MEAPVRHAAVRALLAVVGVPEVVTPPCVMQSGVEVIGEFPKELAEGVADGAQGAMGAGVFVKTGRGVGLLHPVIPQK